VRHLRGDIAGAHADYDATVDLGHSPRTVHAIAAYAAAQLGDTEHALMHCRHAANTHRAGRTGRLVLAWILWRAERRADALDALADAWTVRWDEYEIDLPLRRLVQEPHALFKEQASDVAMICLRRAKQALDSREYAVAARALGGAAEISEREEGRYHYLRARFLATQDSEPEIIDALEALESAAATRYRPTGTFGGEAEFEPLRKLGRFRKIVAGVR
jgi:tetratricopeptide (TPR) repeat protein